MKEQTNGTNNQIKTNQMSKIQSLNYGMMIKLLTIPSILTEKINRMK
jgi:hypothetical protein